MLRPFILLTMATCALALPAAGQAPAPTTTALDGTYYGVSRTFEEDSTPFRAGATWTHYCPQPFGPPGALTIVNGTAKAGKLEGSVSPQGVLVMRNSWGVHFDGRIDSQGTVRGRSTGGCDYQLVWQKVPPPTLPFDGDYIGVSRESSGWGPECPANGVPGMVWIRNSVVLGRWQGTIGPQGAVVMQSPGFSRVDAQIDPQGFLKGKYSGRACTTAFVWRKQSG
jgi:hypothetical protein